MLRQILVLAAISIAGVALLAPVAAHSAAPAPIAVPDGLLPATDPPRLMADRGALSGRQGTSQLAADLTLAEGEAQGTEEFGDPVVPTPAAAPMEPTLELIPTPKPTPAPTPPPAPVAAAPAPAPQRVVTYDGDSVWDDLAKCESGGNWAINTGNGYYGGLQFSLPTWQGYGGAEFAAYPHEATRAEQIAVAERLRAARGFSPWPACSAKLGLS